MAFSVRIEADSYPIGGNDNTRLTTMLLTYPLCIHAEFMTHRQFARNVASNRAIPVKKQIERVKEDPFIPLHWGENRGGMTASHQIAKNLRTVAERYWVQGMRDACKAAEQLRELNVHKQITNRLLGPYQWTTVIATADARCWNHFFTLRTAADAEPHMQHIAKMAQSSYQQSQPRELALHQWHIPFVRDADNYLSTEDLLKVATGRCARVSYETHDGQRDVQKDIELHDRLVASKHWSPFEHCAQHARLTKEYSGNFGLPWFQYRKNFKGEYTTNG